MQRHYEALARGWEAESRLCEDEATRQRYLRKSLLYVRMALKAKALPSANPPHIVARRRAAGAHERA